MVVVLIGVCVAVAYVVVPLLSGERTQSDGWGPALEHEARKNAALLAIIDLEAERDGNKLSEKEFDALRRDYEREALAAIRELDILHEAAADHDPLEQEIAALRAELTCPTCGAIRKPGGGCATCGG